VLDKEPVIYSAIVYEGRLEPFPAQEEGERDFYVEFCAKSGRKNSTCGKFKRIKPLKY